MNKVELPQRITNNTETSAEILPYHQIPPAYVTGGEANNRSPLIFSAPHAGTFYAAELFDLENITAAQLFEETGTNALATFLSSSRRPAVIASAARAVVDVNRPATALDPKLHQLSHKQNDVYTRYVDAGYGVVPRLDVNRKPLHHNHVEVDLAARLIALHHHPYHQLLETQVSKTSRTCPEILLIDIHSMPDNPFQRQHPDIVFGNIFGATMPEKWAKKIDNFMRESGYSWGWNSPYAGGYITRHFGLSHQPPKAELSTLQIECNRALYAPQAKKPEESFNQLAVFLETLSDRLEKDILAS